jgi:hypothetical protein
VEADAEIYYDWKSKDVKYEPLKIAMVAFLRSSKSFDEPKIVLSLRDVFFAAKQSFKVP